MFIRVGFGLFKLVYSHWQVPELILSQLWEIVKVTSTDSDKVIVRRMMALAKSPNKLQNKVMKSSLDKKTDNMEKIDDTLTISQS